MYNLVITLYIDQILCLFSGVVMFNKKENCDIDKIKKACQNWLKQAPNRKQETID